MRGHTGANRVYPRRLCPTRQSPFVSGDSSTWFSCSLSSFLDSDPTYLTFATLAAGSTDLSKLVQNQVPGCDGPLILAAISCGAVFLGAMTYVGNGPNFMVKAIAEDNGYATPS